MILKSIIKNYELIGVLITLLLTIYLTYVPKLTFDSRELILEDVGNPILDINNQAAIYNITVKFKVYNSGFKESNVSKLEVVPLDDIKDFNVLYSNIEEETIDPKSDRILSGNFIVETTRFQKSIHKDSSINSFLLLMFIYDKDGMQIKDLGYPTPMKLSIYPPKTADN